MKKTEFPDKAEKFWDRTASYYDKAERRDEHTYLKFIEKAKTHFRAGDIVMDFGCGTGLICNEIADKVKKIYAVDVSSKMIKIARDKAVERKIQNIDFVHSTIFDEQFKPDSLDVILVFNVLHLLEGAQNVVQRINELLKPEGLVISATPCMGEKPLLNKLFSIGQSIGIFPGIISFKYSGLEQIFEKGYFKITESGCLKKSSVQYVLIAKKIKDANYYN